jgi:hypothetical protein
MKSCEDSSHWYSPEGKPVYEIKCSTTEGYRSVRKTDVEKLHLYPSITTILNLYPKPDLSRWKINKHIDSALTLPKIEGESLDDFKKRIFEDAGQESKNATTLGTDLHNYAEYLTSGRQHEPFQRLQLFPDIQEGFYQWHKKQKYQGICEEIMVNHRLKLAGKIDFNGEFNGKRVVLDYKTKKTKKGIKIEPYETYGIQLAGYELLSISPYEKHIIVVVSTTEPGRIETIEYSKEDIKKYKQLVRLFRHCFKIIEGV